ncbi:MAG: hypothetical protein ACKVHO_13890 [Verrucomicrobiia bacterium]
MAEDIVAYRDGFATSAENARLLTLIHLFIYRHREIAAALTIDLLLVIGFMAKVISSERRATGEANRAVITMQNLRAGCSISSRNNCGRGHDKLIRRGGRH